MWKVLAILLVGASLGGCAKDLQKFEAIYTVATTATVPASDVIIAANAFDALTATATNYGNYCISQNFPRPLCSAANRRAIVKYVNAGTNAKHALEGSITNNQPAIATVYNALIGAVKGLQSSPINTVKG